MPPFVCDRPISNDTFRQGKARYFRPMNFLAKNAPAMPTPSKLMVAGSGTETGLPAIADPAIIAKPNAAPAMVTIRSVI